MKRMITKKEYNELKQKNINFLKDLKDRGELIEEVAERDVEKLTEDWFKENYYEELTKQVDYDWFFEQLKNSYKDYNISAIWRNIKSYEDATGKELLFEVNFIKQIWVEKNNYTEAKNFLSKAKNEPVVYDSFYEMYEIGTDIMVEGTAISKVLGKNSFDSYMDFYRCQIAKEFIILVRNKDAVIGEEHEE